MELETLKKSYVTFKVTQGHWHYRHSTSHTWFTIRSSISL